MFPFWRHTVYSFFSFLGGSFVYLACFVFFFFFHRALSFYLLAGYVPHLFILGAIRLVYYKERPKKRPVQNLFGRLTTGSFPSGHALRSFYVALTIGLFYPQPSLVCILILLAVLVAYSRYLLREHYAIDVIAGVLLGIILWWMVLTLFPFYSLF